MTTMMFCPKCGSIMGPKEEKGKRFLACKCGYTDKKAKSEMKEESGPKEEIQIIDSDDNPMPVVEHICDACKNDQAYFWSIQTRASDEAETQFFRCTKCGKTVKGSS